MLRPLWGSGSGRRLWASAHALLRTHRRRRHVPKLADIDFIPCMAGWRTDVSRLLRHSRYVAGTNP
jgi:hypothetical protein